MATPHLNLVTLIIVSSSIVNTEHPSLLDDERCYCDGGCYNNPGMDVLVCCSNVCEWAEERGTSQECSEFCPCYSIVKKKQFKLGKLLGQCKMSNSSLAAKLEDAKSERSRLRKELIAALKELEKLRLSLREMKESRQFIAAVVTPICLFGFLSLVFLCYACSCTTSTKLNTSKHSHGHFLRSLSDGDSAGDVFSREEFDETNKRGFDGKSTMENDCGKYAGHGLASHAYQFRSLYDTNAPVESKVKLSEESSKRSSARNSRFSTAGPRPQLLEGESNRASRPSELALSRSEAPALDPNLQPLFQPLATSWPLLHQHRSHSRERDSTSLQNYGAAAAGLTSAESSPTTPRSRKRAANQETKKARLDSSAYKLDSSAYKLANLDINAVLA